MASTIAVPDRQNIGANVQAIGDALSDVAAAAKADIEALQGSGEVQKRTLTVGQADLTDAVNGEAQAINVGAALPANAVISAARVTLTTPFTGGGASAVTLDVGWSGATTAAFSSFDALGSSAGVYLDGASPVAKPVEASSKQLIATFTPDVGHSLLNLTAGAATIDIYYFVAF